MDIDLLSQMDIDVMIADLHVARGAVYLAQQGHSITEIDPDILDVMDSARCPAGQTMGYVTVADGHTSWWLAEHGFIPDSCKATARDTINAAWRAAIMRARGGQ